MLKIVMKKFILVLLFLFISLETRSEEYIIEEKTDDYVIVINKKTNVSKIHKNK
jgi:hypothetical protein